MNSRFAFKGVVYETGEYTFETRPDCLVLPDGKVLLVEYKEDGEHIRSIQLATVANAVVSSNQNTKYEPVKKTC